MVSLKADEDVLDGFGFFDFVFCSVSNEDGLASPFNDNILAFWNGREIDFNLGHSKHIGGGGHVDQKVCNKLELACRIFNFTLVNHGPAIFPMISLRS